MLKLPKTKIFKVDKWPIPRSERISMIRSVGHFTCPGCLKSMSAVDAIYAMNICHVHSFRCWRHKGSNAFVACSGCNSSQSTWCGVYENGFLMPLCELKSRDVKPSMPYISSNYDKNNWFKQTKGE